MRINNLVFVLLFLSLTVSCASISSIYDVRHDYDKQVDFQSLKTYNWKTIPENAYINSLDIERVKNAVNAGLQAKGLTMATDNPDFLIVEHFGQKDKVQINSIGGGYWDAGWGSGIISSYEFEEGSLILDIVDTKSKKMIWHGAAKAVVDSADTPEKREKLINEAVQEILKNFPPKPKI